MSLSLTDALKVKQKARAETRRPKTQILLKGLFEYLNSHKRNPQLQFSTFDQLSTATTGSNTVMADTACRLYAIFIKSPSGAGAATTVKITDDETTASASTFSDCFRVDAKQEEIIIFPDGKLYANGIALTATQSADSSTASSSSDRPSGFVIVGG